MPETTLQRAQSISEALIGWRRHLHANPELSGQERQTAAFVAGALRDMGYAPQENVGGGYGVVAELTAGSGPAVALRADMDALPIAESTGLPFASRNPGVMHACGHDAHTAMLLGAARLLAERRAELKRPVRFLFQPSEELYPGGAPQLINGGALDGVEAVFGLHIISVLPAGVVGGRSGPFMAAVNTLDVRVIGRGGHAAMPESCVDPIVTASAMVLSLQSVVSRNVGMHENAVVSVTQINAGSADNVIPNEVRLRGTIRTFDEGVRSRVIERVTELCRSVAQAHGATAEVTISPGYPVLVNDPGAFDRAMSAARAAGVPEAACQELPLQGGGEDFAYYGAKAPAAFVFLGAAVPDPARVFPHHHPQFDVDERMLPLGTAILAEFALRS
ncbi:MAG: amidohydrolase [Planctomycetia bacterium]|nr:MAG: amidohydrolase [Planctomycetia bacterium]